MSPPAAPELERRPRLNPFAFPSDTTFRFVLLVVAVLGSTLYAWNWIYAAAGDHAERFLRASQACLASEPTQFTGLDDFTASSRAFTACVQASNRPIAWWMLGGLALVLGLALALTLAQPWWRRRRLRLRPLRQEDAPAVVAEVAVLAEEAGLRELPALVWNPLDRSPTGLAFGYAGSYTVALSGGLVVRQAVDPEAFRAVVRHELAHIRNRDVDLTYFTISLWHAFLLGAVLPFVVTLLDEGIAANASAGWRIGALAVLVYLTRNAVLRSREIYADVRASAAPGGAAGMRQVLAGLPRPRRDAYGGLLRVHPRPAQRLAAVDDTRPLFALDLTTAFGAGISATVAYESVVAFVSVFVSDPLDMRFLAALAFAPATIGVVGVALWRSSFGSLAGGQRPPAAWPLALALAAGFMVGPELALVRIADAGGDDAMLGELLHGRGLSWAAGLVVALVLTLAWIRACASAWLRSLAGRSPRAATAVGLLAGAGLLTIVLGVFYVSRDTRAVIRAARDASALQHEAVSQVVWAGPEWLWQLALNPQLEWVLLRPEILPAAILLWAFPLAAVLLRRGPAENDETRWAFLDPGGRLDVPRLASHVLRPLAVGLAAGGAFLLAELLLRLGIRTAVSAATRQRDELLLAFFAWQIALALAAQAAAGAVATAVSGHRARVVDGLAAAFVAGSTAVLGIVAGPSAAGCVDPIALNPGPCTWSVSADFTWIVYRQVVAEGALAALAAGLVVAGVLGLLRRRASAEELQPARLAG